ncbi:MAG: DUF3793 family protein [Ruminococcus sp.]|nr:DUF3793 family protein [Ruminococcus sp.]
MPEELVIRHCSPTLAGLKTANMFACSYENESELKNDVTAFNKRFAAKGIRVVPLRYSNGKALIYIFRPSRLEADLSDVKADKVLRRCGYHCGDISKCLSDLINRIEESEEFPHEIGIFLGYPPEDVIGFIEKRECQATGFWKVYSNKDKAEKIFDQFRKCMNVYYKCWNEGFTLERLTVSI